jgi:long-chain acyl-CoA synthetase
MNEAGLRQSSEYGPGLLYGDQFFPHAEVTVRIAKAASGFKNRGLKCDQTAALMLRNDVAYIEATMAIRKLGGMPVPINWHLKGEELAYILQDCGTNVLVIHSDLYHDLQEHIPDNIQVFEVETPELLVTTFGLSGEGLARHEDTTDWNEWIDSQEPFTEEITVQTASMIYTSGTTGRPKGVKREAATPEQHAESIRVVGAVLGVKPGIHTVVPAPMYHSAPNAFSLFAFQLETFLVIMPRFDAEDFLRVIDQYKVSHVQMVPTMFIRLLKLPDEVRNRYDLSSLEYVVHAAAPCPPDVKKDMIEWFGPIIHEYYGSTEMGSVTLATSEEALRFPGTVGKAIPESTVIIVDDEGNEAPPDTIGTVYAMLHTSTEFTYQGDDEKRQSVGRDDLITSGDIGYLNDEGFLFLCDRASDMIISGGVNIYPAEIESVLIGMDKVKDSAVFGIPDADFGEKIAAIIQLEPDQKCTEAEVEEFLKEKLAGYKMPRHIEFRKDLPREDSGKLFKRILRAEFWEDSGRSI